MDVEAINAVVAKRPVRAIPMVQKSDFISWDKDTRTVYSDRTKIIGEVIDKFIDRNIRGIRVQF